MSDKPKSGDKPPVASAAAGEGQDMIEALRRLVAERRRYPLDAYLFLYEALDSAQQVVGEKGHVSPRELLEGFRRLSIERFGPLTLMVLRHWGVRRTEDVGEIVFSLVERGLMRKTEQDRVEDFDGVYDFDEVFHPDNVVAAVDTRSLGPPYPILPRILSGARNAKVTP